jgi:hypothetical protein
MRGWAPVSYVTHSYIICLSASACRAAQPPFWAVRFYVATVNRWLELQKTRHWRILLNSLNI